MSKLVISVLGTPEIEVDGVPVQVDTRKAIALLVYLAVTRRTQSRDRLTGLLWPDYDQERARAALRRTLSTLKKALGDRWVSADRLGVSLDQNDVELDLAALRAAVAAAASHGHPADRACPECAAPLETALEQTGTFLQGFSLRDAEPFEEWQSLEAENVEREVSSALDRLVHGHTAAGNLEAASAAAVRKLALDPLDEPAHRQLMQLLAWRGMRTAALQQYRDCVAVLDRELGVSPLPETTALYEAIAEGAIESREHPTLVQPDEVAPVHPWHHMLRGRAPELDRLLDRFSKISAVGELAVIEGEAGIGKTRLAREFVAWAGGRGASIAEARSHEGETRLPYSLIGQLLDQLAERAQEEVDPATIAEVSRLVPRLQQGGVSPAPIDDTGALARFFESVRKVLVTCLGGSRPGVVFLDDLQWCDPASLDVLSYVARRLDQAPLFIVAGWRSEEVDQDHPLRRLASDAARSGYLTTLVLERLGSDDVRGLVEDATGLDARAAETMTSRLMEETEGIPLFVVEYLAARATGADATTEWQMPVTIKELLRSRARSVGQTARQIMGTAAVIDRSFDFDAVWRASGRTELEAVDALEELVRHGLVVAHAAPQAQAVYEFSHEKLRRYVYGALSAARRRVLHRRVADAFLSSARRPEQVRSVAALIARHMELGGMEAEAATYHEMAAQRARDVFANREALDHYLSALALGHPDPASLHEGAGDMFVLLGRYGNAIDSYERSAALAGQQSIPRLEHKLGEVHLRRGDWELSQSHLQAALDTLEPEGEAIVARARLLAALSFTAYRKGDLDEAIDLASRALEAATASSDDRALAQAQNQLGILENARARNDQAIAYLEDSLRLATELEDAPGQVAALNNLALAQRSRGDVERALELTSKALRICEQQGDSHREAALLNNIADLLHQKGENETAMEHLKKATAMLAEIGDEPAGPLPEVWKLVEW